MNTIDTCELIEYFLENELYIKELIICKTILFADHRPFSTENVVHNVLQCIPNIVLG